MVSIETTLLRIWFNKYMSILKTCIDSDIGNEELLNIHPTMSIKVGFVIV